MLKPGASVGAYRVIRCLGTGGMAHVYLAQGYDGEVVALKVLRRELVPELAFVARFDREARKAAALHHPNIVRILRPLQRSDGWRFLPMQYIPGSTLRHLISATHRLPWPRAGRIASHVCKALAHAHSCGIFHRDVKPANILIAGDDRAYLTDFGILRAAESSQVLTRAHEIIGTPQYISPEHMRGSITGATDVYSLGVVLFEMVTGRVPFDSPSDFAIMEHHMRSAPPRPSRLNPQVPKELCDLILAALSKDPSERPSAARMAFELDALCGLAVLKADPPIGHRPGHPGGASVRNRHKRALTTDRRTMIAVLLLADVVALIGTILVLMMSNQ